MDTKNGDTKAQEKVVQDTPQEEVKTRQSIKDERKSPKLVNSPVNRSPQKSSK